LETSGVCHRKIWAMARHGGHQLMMSTVLRILRDDGLLLGASAGFCEPPTGPKQVWQFDFSEYETSRGGTSDRLGRGPMVEV
jgi:putative transposase